MSSFCGMRAGYQEMDDEELMPLKAHLTDLDYHIRYMGDVLKSEGEESHGEESLGFDMNVQSKGIQVAKESAGGVTSWFSNQASKVSILVGLFVLSNALIFNFQPFSA